MKVVSLDHVKLDLGSSLLNELDGVELSGVIDIDGAVALDDEQRILPLITSFLSKRQASQKTAAASSKTYGVNLTYCLTYLMSRPEFKSFELDQAFMTVSRPVLEDYFTYARDAEELAASTLRNRDATLKVFFEEFLCKRSSSAPALRDDNPYEDGLLTPSPASGLVKYCDLEALEALMFCARYERERLVLQFIFDAGVRRSELGRITLANVKRAANFQKAQFYGSSKEHSVHPDGYLPIKIEGSKGRGRQTKPRYTLVSVATLNRIKSYHASPLYKKHARKYGCDEETPAFINANGGVFHERVVDKLLLKVSNRAIKNRRIEKNISPHKLRHGFAYEVLKSPDFGADYLDRLVHVQKTLGHNDLSSTEVYTRIPIELYRTMTDENGVVLTKAERMKQLSRRTKLKIKVGDQK